MDQNKQQSPMQLLKQHFPSLYKLQLLMLDGSVSTNSDKKLQLLLETIVNYNTSGATGSILIDYSKGRIGNIDTRVRITAGTAAPHDDY